MLWPIKFVWITKLIGHFWVPITLTFKMRLGAQPFFWKWVLFAREWKMIPYQRLSTYPRFETEARGRKWPILNSFNQSKLEAGACRRSKGRENVLADQWNAKLLSDPLNQSKLKAGACSWRYARENVCKQVTIELLLLLIGWKSGAKCFSQSHYVAIQKQSNSELVSILSNPVVKTQWRLTKLMILSKLNLT